MFTVLKTTKFDGYEFELLEHVETKCECIRMRYDNNVGHTSRGCPIVWLQDLPAFIHASFNLLSNTKEPSNETSDT